MHYYCTLFDSNYLARGLVLYESLKRHSSEDFLLFVLPMDEKCRELLGKLNLSKVVVVSPEAFEKAFRMDVPKGNRTWQEYCWTCASNLTAYLFAKNPIREITYLDADMMFFSDPEVVFDEIGMREIAAIPHRFVPEKEHLAVNGFFNVSWVTFKDGKVGRQCLERWAKQCWDWCYYRVEEGRFGDQKYLDEWPGLYKEAFCAVENAGAGLAPWNVGNYTVLSVDGSTRLLHPPYVTTHFGEPVVFYHYHEFKETPTGYYLTGYSIKPEVKGFIYDPYLKAYEEQKKRISEIAK